MKKCLVILLTLSLFLIAIVPASAQETDKPVVFAVFLYSQTCPHCHAFISDDLPGILEEFGDQLKIIAFDLYTQEGQVAGQIIFDGMNVPAENRVVPTMIIGTTVLQGGIEIPARMPQIVRDGLAHGGIGLPPVPELQAAYADSIAGDATPSGDATTSATPDANATPEATTEAPAGIITTEGLSIGDKLAADPVANAIAIAVLIGLIITAGLVVWATIRGFSGSDSAQWAIQWLKGRVSWVGMMLAAVVGLAVAATLVSHSESDSLATPLAWAVALAMLVVAATIFLAGASSGRMKQRFQLPIWVLPLVVAAGIAVAYYLAYVETNEVAAVCGIVGDCNTVQQSEYAVLFGIIPIGVMGIAGYLMILAAWLVSRVKNERLAQWSNVAILVMALFGVLFSIYLTFLEPFVIGATCAWCLTSAIVMMLILWLVAGDGLRDLLAILNRQPPAAKPVLNG